MVLAHWTTRYVVPLLTLFADFDPTSLDFYFLFVMCLAEKYLLAFVYDLFDPTKNQTHDLMYLSLAHLTIGQPRLFQKCKIYWKYGWSGDLQKRTHGNRFSHSVCYCCLSFGPQLRLV